MHLAHGDVADDQDRGNGEADRGERGAEAHIDRALETIVERRPESAEAFRSQHQNGDQQPTERIGQIE